MIPKIIHFCWLSEEAYPEKIEKCIRSWNEVMPEYKIVLWNRSKINLGITKWTLQAYKSRKYAFASDFIRFYALYHYGGIYLDSDVEVIKSFDDLLDRQFFFGYEYTGVPEAAVVGAEKGLLWCKKCMDWYYQHEFINHDNSMNMIIAPLVMKWGFETTYNYELIDREKIQKIGQGVIFPNEYFSPKNIYTGEIETTKNTYTIHHFNSAWLKKGRIVRIKRNLHIGIIKVIGKKNYNYCLYKYRKLIKKF